MNVLYFHVIFHSVWQSLLKYSSASYRYFSRKGNQDYFACRKQKPRPLHRRIGKNCKKLVLLFYWTCADDQKLKQDAPKGIKRKRNDVPSKPAKKVMTSASTRTVTTSITTEKEIKSPSLPEKPLDLSKQK